MCRASDTFEFKTDFRPGLTFSEGQAMPLNSTGHLLTFDLNPFTGRIVIQYPKSMRGLSYLSCAWNYADSTDFFRVLAADPGFVSGGVTLSELRDICSAFDFDDGLLAPSLWPTSDVRRSYV